MPDREVRPLPKRVQAMMQEFIGDIRRAQDHTPWVRDRIIEVMAKYNEFPTTVVLDALTDAMVRKIDAEVARATGKTA